MKRIFQKTFFALAVVLGLSAGVAQAQNVGDTFNDGTFVYKITSLSPNEVQVGDDSSREGNAVVSAISGSITIPESVTGGTGALTYSVTEIGERAFEDCSSLTSVTIPESVTTIGYYAFYGCTNLTSVTLLKELSSSGDTPPSIGSNAFDRSSVTFFVPSKSLSRYMTAYSSIYANMYNIENPHFRSIEGGEFGYVVNYYTNNCNLVFSGSADNYTLSITGTGEITYLSYNFSNPLSFFDGVTAVIVNDINNNYNQLERNITSIGRYAFRNFQNLTSVIFYPPNTPSSTSTSIGESAFENCAKLTSVILPRSVTSIGVGAFYNCRKLTSISLSNGSSLTDASYIPWNGTRPSTAVVLPFANIGQGAFYGCESITAVALYSPTYNAPEITIGTMAFGNCNSLKLFNIYGNTFPVFGDNVFYFSSMSSDGIKFQLQGAEMLTKCIAAITAQTQGMPGSMLQYIRFESISSFGLGGFADGIAWSVVNGDNISSNLKMTLSGTGTVSQNWWYSFQNSVPSFSSINNIKTLIIGKGISSIAGSFFTYDNKMSGLESIEVDNDNPYLSSEDGVLFNKDKTILIRYLRYPSDRSYYIPASVTNIGDYAFDTYFSSYIGSLTNLAATPQSINTNVFYNTDFSYATLYVPLSSVAAYQAADVWKDFGKIIGIGADVDISSEEKSFALTLYAPTQAAVTGGSFTVTLPEGVAVDEDNSVLSPTLASTHRLAIDNNGDGSWTFTVSAASAGASSLRSSTETENARDIVTIAYTVSAELASGDYTAVVSDLHFTFADNTEYSEEELTVTINVSEETTTSPNVDDTFNDGIFVYKITSLDPAEVSVGTGWSAGSGLVSGTAYSGDATIPESVTGGTGNLTYSVTSIEYGAFYNCTGLTSVTIPNSVTSIENFAFMQCRALTSAIIGNSVTTIGSNAFQSCSGLTSITIPNSVTTIGSNAFASCSGLTSVTVGNSVNSIGESAFESCSNLTSVIIPNSVTTMGNSVLSGCKSLTSAVIGNSVMSIGTGAFYNCKALTSVSIGNSVTTVGDHAFQYCSSLTSITVPNSVTSIGSSAFNGCSALTSVTIGNSVATIGNNAFQECSSIESIVSFATTPPTLNSGAFYAVSYAITTVIVPCGTLADYQAAWQNFTNISEDCSSADFVIEATETRQATDYTGGNIIFKSDNNNTAQLTGATNLQVSGVVKVVKTFDVDKWYPVGFPFKIESISIAQGGSTVDGVIYDEDNDEIDPESIDNATDDNFFVKYYDGEINRFRFADQMKKDSAYIVLFPHDPFSNGSTVEVTFTSTAYPTLNSGSGTGTFTEDESNYTLAVNPFVANVDNFGSNLIYYQYVLADNHFPKTSLTSLNPIKPFEALVIYSGSGTPNRVIGQGLDETAIETVHADDPIVAVHYYNLSGAEISLESGKAQPGIYIVKTIYRSGKTTVTKQIKH